MKNKLPDLRNHLFVTIESLLDPDKPMDIDRAKAVAEVAQTIINSAKVEVEYIRQIGSTNGTGFIPVEKEIGGQCEAPPEHPHRPLVGVVKSGRP